MIFIRLRKFSSIPSLLSVCGFFLSFVQCFFFIYCCGSQWGWFYLLGDIWQCLEIVLVVIIRWVQLVSGGQRPGVVLCILQCTGWLSTWRVLWPQISTVLRLRRYDHILFLLFSANKLNYNDWFSNIKPTLLSWNKSNLVVMFISFLYITEFDLLILCLEFQNLFIKQIGL